MTKSKKPVSLSPIKTLPDCMMPDGAEPCVGYRQLYAEVERLKQENAQLRTELQAMQAAVR